MIPLFYQMLEYIGLSYGGEFGIPISHDDFKRQIVAAVDAEDYDKVSDLIALKEFCTYHTFSVKGYDMDNFETDGQVMNYEQSDKVYVYCECVNDVQKSYNMALQYLTRYTYT